MKMLSGIAVVVLGFLVACSDSTPHKQSEHGSALACEVDADCEAFVDTCGAGVAFRKDAVERMKLEMAKTTPSCKEAGLRSFEISTRAVCDENKICRARNEYTPKADSTACADLEASPGRVFRSVQTAPLSDNAMLHVCREVGVVGMKEQEDPSLDRFLVVQGELVREVEGILKEQSSTVTLVGEKKNLRLRSELTLGGSYADQSLVVLARLECASEKSCKAVNEKCELPKNYTAALKEWEAHPDRAQLPDLAAFARAGACK